MSAPKVLKGGGLFSSEPLFAGFLSDAGQEPEDANALPPRNFLLDEGVSMARVESYRSHGGIAAHGTLVAWLSAHETYLAERVLRSHSGSLPTSIDPADPDECPETFHAISPASPFLATDPRVHLIRTVEVASLARRSGRPAAEIQGLAQELVDAPGVEPARTRLDDILQEFAKRCDLRPVFAAFWDDLSDLFPGSASTDVPGWVDTVRDRCGLSHLDPRARGVPIPVLLFRYKVGDVPGLRGRRGTQPLVPPTVLDGPPFPPFCPAPGFSLTGATINLDGSSGVEHREVLHPCVAFRAEHVFRVGVVTRPVDLALLHMARGLHLLDVRDRTKRADYAEGTDGDLF